MGRKLVWASRILMLVLCRLAEANVKGRCQNTAGTCQPKAIKDDPKAIQLNVLCVHKMKYIASTRCADPKQYCTAH